MILIVLHCILSLLMNNLFNKQRCLNLDMGKESHYNLTKSIPENNVYVYRYSNLRTFFNYPLESQIFIATSSFLFPAAQPSPNAAAPTSQPVLYAASDSQASCR